LPRVRNKGNNPPGQHGEKRKRYSSAYSFQNREKQKIKISYGLREKQLYNLFAKLKKEKGNISDNLLINCESRLDNLVFRSGLINTLRFSRQLVSHGHFLVNGKKVKTPSYQLEVGDVVSFRKEKMSQNKLIKKNLEQNVKFPDYISFDKQKLTITYLRHPFPEEIKKDIDTSLVVEWYN